MVLFKSKIYNVVCLNQIKLNALMYRTVHMKQGKNKKKYEVN